MSFVFNIYIKQFLLRKNSLSWSLALTVCTFLKVLWGPLVRIFYSIYLFSSFSLRTAATTEQKCPAAASDRFTSCWSAASPPTPAVNAGLSSLPPNHPKWLQAPPPVASASSPPLNRHGRACMLAFRRGQARLANASGRRSQVAHGRRSLFV
jgi:hypothetical protein